MPNAMEKAASEVMGAAKDVKAGFKGLTGVFMHLMEEHGKVGALIKRVGMSSDSSDLSFDAVVEVVEPLGAEILLDTKAAAQQIVARVEPTVKTKPHEKIRLTFIPDRIHFFDSKTEAVIK